MVMAMVAVVSLAIYGNFSSGVKIWKRVNTVSPQESVDIFFEKFDVELRNALKFTGIDFSGTQEFLEFPTLVNSAILSITPGKVAYKYDSGKRTLYKWQHDYSQIYMAQEDARREVLGNVRSLRFSYYFYDTQKKQYLWIEEWKTKQMPLAIRAEFELIGPQGNLHYTKTIMIPVGD